VADGSFRADLTLIERMKAFGIPRPRVAGSALL
jgi:hypothetical protein